MYFLNRLLGFYQTGMQSSVGAAHSGIILELFQTILQKVVWNSSRIIPEQVSQNSSGTAPD